MAANQDTRPNCMECFHFYITHEPAHPYGCRAIGFKSSQYPAVVVYKNSGIHCQLYRPKR
ncbi:MAG: uracil-DNA glycosylase [Desulfobulbaceae bacterium]|nr:uracil-DNA glycosylase [Desulfobulbaceae bacterium]HIJ78674.1 uracil-DNA glycosylase [Deltaproteobacteria bacterium]